jgi:hypothetical protein
MKGGSPFEAPSGVRVESARNTPSPTGARATNPRRARGEPQASADVAPLAVKVTIPLAAPTPALEDALDQLLFRLLVEAVERELAGGREESSSSGERKFLR